MRRVRARSSQVLVATVALVIVGWPHAAARATPPAACPVPPGADAVLGEFGARQRLAWIDANLGEAAHTARIWAWGWGGGIAASGVFALAAVPFVAPENRVDWYTGAVSAGIGVIPFLVVPLSVLRDAPEVHAAVANVNDTNLCATLAQAEDALVRGARTESQQRAWYVHVGNVVFNTGVLLFLGLGYHHWEAGLINGGAGLAVGEALILTSPTKAIDDLQTYRRGEIGGAPQSALAGGWAFRF